ncbi:MAG: CHAD domain-containing protein [Acidisphaera sp.]|nr:CHAD domain-containing protein [Acidisphaera sp.]
MAPDDIAGEAEGGARKAAPVDLPENVLLGEAFREIAGSALGDLLGNAPVAAAGDPEGVHQVRIAIRRLRAALLLFRRELDPEPAARFEAELKRLGQISGAARDWDVFCVQTLRDADKDIDVSAVRPVAEARRQAAHRQLGEALQASSFSWLVLGFSAWIEGALTAPFRELPLREEAGALLGRVERKVLKQGKHVDGGSVEELHALRKSLKKLRYAIESLAGLYRRKQVRAYLHGLKALQQRLGVFNDAAVTAQLAEGVAEESPAATALIYWSRLRRDEALADLPRSWKRFRREPSFWD